MRKIAKIIQTNPNGLLHCEIDCTAACNGCAMKKSCNPTQNNRKISLKNNSSIPQNELNPGTTIEVEVSTAMGIRAIIIAYLLPVLILLLSIITCSALHLGELTQGITAISLTTLYYISVKILRLDRNVTIEIIKKIQ